MKRSQLFLSFTCLSLMVGSATAAPLCPEMLDKAGLENRYQRLAPIYNSAETGWIFGSDQFDNGFVLDAAQQSLMAQIVNAFAARGTELAVMIAPPRPVIAGQAVVDVTLGEAGGHDVDAQAAAFQTMIAQINAAGAVAPDLLALATSDEALQDDYYFARDTHWTSIGAAYSALELAAHLSPEAAPTFNVSALNVVETFEERGSLSDIARATCQVEPANEPTPVFDYSTLLPAAGDLFGDATTEDHAVLVGTSFSDRNKRDQYQVADALSAALGMSVTNLSVSGGGMIGPLETYILTGQFAADKPSLVIWEFPYTYELQEAQLRQILGALRSDDRPMQTAEHAASDGKLKLTLAAGEDLVGITPRDGMPLKISVKLRFADGSVTKLPLTRKRRMAEVATLETWWLDLSGLVDEAAKLDIEFKRKDAVSTIEILWQQASSYVGDTFREFGVGEELALFGRLRWCV